MPDLPLFSDEWLAACNTALASVEAAGHRERALVVTERLTDAPRGTRTAVTLIADDAGVRLVDGEHEDASAWLTVSADDARALHEGRLAPAAALAEGRLRVRGDLRGVVEAVGVLAAAHEALRGVSDNPSAH